MDCKWCGGEGLQDYGHKRNMCETCGKIYARWNSYKTIARNNNTPSNQARLQKYNEYYEARARHGFKVPRAFGGTVSNTVDSFMEDFMNAQEVE